MSAGECPFLYQKDIFHSEIERALNLNPSTSQNVRRVQDSKSVPDVNIPKVRKFLSSQDF